jgi:hypothetical protein
LNAERDGFIAGQKITTARDMLRKLADGDYFKVDHVVGYLHKQLWSDHVDDLAKRGVIGPNVRRFYKANEDLINVRNHFGLSVTKPIPDQND